MEIKKIILSTDGIGEALDFIEHSLYQHRLQARTVNEAMLLTEETMVKMLDHGLEESELTVFLHARMGIAQIRLEIEGEELHIADNKVPGLDLNRDEIGKEAESAIRSIFLRLYDDKIKYKYKDGVNIIHITAGVPEKIFALVTLGAFLGGLFFGVLMNLFPYTYLMEEINRYLLSPINSIFINALQLITAPAVFCSIVCCMSQVTRFSVPGRVSFKILVTYIITSIIAVIVGVAAFNFLKPGSIGLLSELVNQSEVTVQGSGNLSVVDTIISVVPTNFIEPFLNVNSLQIVFLGLMCGVATGRVGDHTHAVSHFFEACNDFFSKIILLVMKFTPIAVFCSTVSMVSKIGIHAIYSLFQMALTVAAGIVIMVGVYALMIVIFGRLNPIPFFRKVLPTMKHVIIMGSELGALSQTTQICKRKLGISSKVYSFSLPVGAVMNLDSNCIYLTIAGLFLARLCGIEIFGTDVLTLIFSVIILSIGAPITPGSAMLCLFVLLGQMNVSTQAIHLIIGVNALIEMILAASNTMGTMAISLVVSRTEKLHDMQLYKKKG